MLMMPTTGCATRTMIRPILLVSSAASIIDDTISFRFEALLGPPSPYLRYVFCFFLFAFFVALDLTLVVTSLPVGAG